MCICCSLYYCSAYSPLCYSKSVENKKELRKSIQNRLKTIDLQLLRQQDEKSCSTLLASKLYREANTIFGFWPLADEPAIHPILHDALQKKKLALPVTLEQGVMLFYRLRSFTDLVEGRYGIAQPSRTEPVQPDSKDLILVPAMAYSLTKARLGRGKGYYDRYLSNKNGAIALGICRTYQLIDHIVTEPWDEKVDMVLCDGVMY